VRIFEKNERISEIPEKSCTKWMDYDIIKNKLEVRYCQPEDFFVMDAVGHKKTIKKFFVDEKIPKKQREEQLVLASESHVFWVLGRRMAEDAKVTGATRRIMEISIDKGDKTDE
jgi:tRNA(Ile)-lysidine synthase